MPDRSSMPKHCFLAVALLALSPQHAAASDQEALLHLFRLGHDGGFPAGGLTADAAGNLYGTTGDGVHTFGTVYRLSPGGAGGWNFHIIYTMTGYFDGAIPTDAVTLDSKGNIYGTSVTGGDASQGAVWQIRLDRSGKRAKLIRTYDFSGYADGGHPNSAVIIDQAGNLYGTTPSTADDSACGAAYELVPDGPVWLPHTLHNFTCGADGGYPNASLVMDASGTLYGTAPYGGTGTGVVFALARQNGRWKETVLHSFDGSDGQTPESNLIFDAAGNLYGTTAGAGGTVFKLAPPANRSDKKARWALTTLFQFPGGAGGAYPYTGLTFDRSGNLYGATDFGGDPSCQNGCGVAYELSPSQGAAWTEKVLHTFHGHRYGANPSSPLLLGADNTLYGTTSAGGKGPGVIFSLTK